MPPRSDRQAPTSLAQPGRAWRRAGLLFGVLAMGGCASLDATMGINRTRELEMRRNQSAPLGSMAPKAEAPLAGAEPLAQAQVLREQGLKDQALAAFERAIAVNPELTVAYMGAGDLYREKGDYPTAQARYERAAALEPRNFDAQYSNGLMLQLLNRLAEAVQAYLNALTIKPEDFKSNLNLATAYLQLGEPAQGLPYAEKAVTLEPDDASARVNLGAIYSALNRHADAVTEYQQASELTELTSPLLLNLAASLGRTGRFEEMLNTLDQLLKIEPSAGAHERKGYAYFKLRRYNEALDSYRAALTLDADYYPALNGVGVCMLNTWIWSSYDDMEAQREAMKALRRSLQIEPKQPQIVELVTKYQ